MKTMEKKNMTDMFIVEDPKENKKNRILWDLIYAEFGELSGLLISLYEEDKLGDVVVTVDGEKVYPSEDEEENTEKEKEE